MYPKMIIAGLLTWLTLLVSCKKNNSDDRTSKLQQVLDNNTRNKFPGLSLYVITKNRTYSLASGKMDITNGLSMTPTTLNYGQSISKTFTAVSIMKLMEEGKLDITKKINVYLGAQLVNMITNGNEITVFQLLNHTSGIYDYLNNADFINDVTNGTAFPLTPLKLVSYVAGKPASFPPGTSFEYSNINYDLLAFIIDTVTNHPHGEYIKNNIILPLHLDHTYYLPGSAFDQPVVGTTKSYSINPGSTVFDDVSDLQFLTVKNLAGDDGIVSTAADLARFYNALLREKTLVSTTSLEKMKTWVTIGGIPIYGLGLIRLEINDFGEQWGHSGAGLGAAAEAYYFPKYDATIVLMTNTGTLFSSEKAAEFDQLWKDILTTLFK